MPKPQKHAERPRDVNQWARQMVQQSTGQTEIVPVEGALSPGVLPMPNAAQISAFMAEMGRRGGLIGGKRRLETMTKTERRKAASKAAKARWGNAKK
jgi:hypothetical protein